ALTNDLWGNAAANILDGGVGTDWLVGGAGNDVYIIDNAGDVVGEEGNTAKGRGVGRANVLRWGQAGMENDSDAGGAGWSCTATGGANNRLSGGSGIDTLNSGDGDDTVLGNAGNDVLSGGIGNDYLDGGAGADRFKGGAGNDVYILDNAGDTVDEEGN